MMALKYDKISQLMNVSSLWAVKISICLFLLRTVRARRNTKECHTFLPGILRELTWASAILLSLQAARRHTGLKRCNRAPNRYSSITSRKRQRMNEETEVKRLDGARRGEGSLPGHWNNLWA